MTVKELREKLSEFDDNLIVTVPNIEWSPYNDELPYEFATNCSRGINEAEGYIFIGWYNEDQKIINRIWEIDCNVTLVAHWKALPTPYTENGQTYVNLGRYPQSVVTDTAIISNLNNITSTNSLGYIEYNGEEYTKVTANTYGSGYTFINGNSISNGSTYYFKVEPIKWRVLINNDGTYKLLSEYILDNMYYYVSGSTRAVNGRTVYANNYMYSNVRAWLNGLNGSSYNVSNYSGKGFIDKAFTEEEKLFIKTTLVDNSASTTSSSSNSFTCPNTYDKVYLLSDEDMFNTEYGFNTTTKSATVTDYARSKGCSMATESSFYGRGSWWLRSPFDFTNFEVSLVQSDGQVRSGIIVYYSDHGVRPALEITIQ